MGLLHCTGASVLVDMGAAGVHVRRAAVMALPPHHPGAYPVAAAVRSSPTVTLLLAVMLLPLGAGHVHGAASAGMTDITENLDRTRAMPGPELASGLNQYINTTIAFVLQLELNPNGTM